MLVNAFRAGKNTKNAKQKRENRSWIINPAKQTDDVKAMRKLLENKEDADDFFGANLATRKGRLAFVGIYHKYFSHNELKWNEPEEGDSEPWNVFFKFKEQFDRVNTLFLSAVEGNHRFIVIIYNLLFRKAHEATRLKLDSNPDEEELLTEEYIAAKAVGPTNTSSRKLRNEGNTDVTKRLWWSMVNGVGDCSKLLPVVFHLPVQEFNDSYTVDDYTDFFKERSRLIYKSKRDSSARNVIQAISELLGGLCPGGDVEPNSDELLNAIFVVDKDGVEQRIKGDTDDAITTALTDKNNLIYDILNSKTPTDTTISDIEKVIYMKGTDGKQYSINTKRSEKVAYYVKKGKLVTLFDLCSAIVYYLILRVLQKEEEQYKDRDEYFPDSVADAMLSKQLYKIFTTAPGTEVKLKCVNGEPAIMNFIGDDKNERFEFGTLIFLLFTVAVFQNKVEGLTNLLENIATENNDASENRAILRRLYVTMILLSRNQYKSLISPLLKASTTTKTVPAVVHKKTLIMLSNTVELLKVIENFGLNPIIREDIVVEDCTNLSSVKKLLRNEGGRDDNIIDIVQEIRKESNKPVRGYLDSLGKQAKNWLVKPQRGKDTAKGVNILTVIYLIHWVDSVVRITKLNTPQTRADMIKKGVWHYGENTFIATPEEKGQQRATLKCFQVNTEDGSMNNMKPAFVEGFVPANGEGFCTYITKVQCICEPVEEGSIYEEAPPPEEIGLEESGPIYFSSISQEVTNENSDCDEDGDSDDGEDVGGGKGAKNTKRKRKGSGSEKQAKKNKVTPSVTPNKSRNRDDATVQTIVTRSIDTSTEEGVRVKGVLDEMMGVDKESMEGMDSDELVKLISGWQTALMGSTDLSNADKSIGDDEESGGVNDGSNSGDKDSEDDLGSNYEERSESLNDEAEDGDNRDDAIIGHIDQLMQSENYEVDDSSYGLMNLHSFIVRLMGGMDAVIEKCQEINMDFTVMDEEELIQRAPEITGKSIVVYSNDATAEQEIQQTVHGSRDGEKECCFKYKDEENEEYWVLLTERTDN